MSDFELKVKMKSEKLSRPVSILQGDQERIDMNGIYCNLILGLDLEDLYLGLVIDQS